MRGAHWIVAAAMALMLPAAAIAQGPATPQATQTTTTEQTYTRTTSMSGDASHWTLSGFVGSNFGAAATDPSIDFGGQLAYLYRGAIGAELLADFAPDFKMNNALLANDPNINAYMVNAIGAVPIGGDGQFSPYVSGGIGGIQLRSDILNIGSSGTTTANQTKVGGNIGAGFMGFAGNVGIRGDVRYFRAFKTDKLTTDANSPADLFAQNLLSGLDFWRANIGVALRW
jgi:opacity protein-like surface antigen